MLLERHRHRRDDSSCTRVTPGSWRRPADIGEQAAIYWQVGFNLARGPVGEAVRGCREILAQTEGNRTLSAEMYHALDTCWGARVPSRRPLEFATRCREINRENGVPVGLLDARAEIVWDIKILAGQTEEAYEVLAEGYEQIDTMEMPLKIMSAWLAHSLFALGRFDEAERSARVAADDDLDWSRYTAFGALAGVLAQRGELEKAERLAREAATWFEGDRVLDRPDGGTPGSREVLRVSGRNDDAVEVLGQALELFEQREDAVSAAGARASIAALV